VIISKIKTCAGGWEFEFQAGQSYPALQTVLHCFNIYTCSCAVCYVV